MKPYPLQVAGHGQLLSVSPGVVRKPVSTPEVACYRALSRDDRMVPFICEVIDVVSEGSTIDMEDLCHMFDAPCVADVKVGRRQHGLDATPAKRAKQEAKCAASTSLALGARICGIVTQSMTVTKREGRALDAAGFGAALRGFAGTARRREAFAARLRALREAVEGGGAAGWRFWSASVLLVFDAARPDGVRVALIDFARCAHVGGGADRDLCDGLANMELALLDR